MDLNSVTDLKNSDRICNKSNITALINLATDSAMECKNVKLSNKFRNRSVIVSDPDAEERS